MANNTAWSGGLLTGVGIAYQPAFNATDLNGLAAGASVMSSVAPFDNTISLDEFMDISFVGALLTATAFPAGWSIAFFLAVLQGNGSTYGDGRLTPGTQVAGTVYSPIMDPLGGIQPATNTTAATPIIGDVGGIVIRPRKFALICQNNTTVALAATGNSCYISTYRQNMNA